MSLKGLGSLGCFSRLDALVTLKDLVVWGISVDWKLSVYMKGPGSLGNLNGLDALGVFESTW